MDLWLMMKDRSMVLSFFIIFILLSLFLLVAARKKRSEMPKTLTVLITVVGTIIIVLSLCAIVIAGTFGYNS
ncbi:hypothetical protein [Sporosarcina sp. BI001-red]|uniref:hypothetical protein n=1 Tax=Sporosarcina sp. BI001-red TaxID=2282866 RepID=UPI0011C06484|nr:hypothetical protein [Sporosarcina sp. BI001-red]